MHEALIFPADCNKRTGMPLIVIFNKFSGVTCVS